jgi:hypothetical protein
MVTVWLHGRQIQYKMLYFFSSFVFFYLLTYMKEFKM